MGSYRFLIRGGTVVDGSGAPARRADVRVRDGLIAEIGHELAAEPRERVVDAAGCYVTPGFIETHNHFDGPMWWNPTLDPMPSYGVTTTINGNCGFSAAPVSDDPQARMEMVKIFSFFEDIPAKPFIDELPWDWRKWSEYRRSLESNLKLTANFGAYAGHIAIRLAVMGMDAWERAATPDEVSKMCVLLDDALAAGALGLSSNLLDYDSQDRAVPSLRADDAEFAALLDVLARYPNASFQMIIDIFVRMTGEASIERLGKLCAPRGIRMQWVGVPTYDFHQEKLKGIVERHAQFKARGLNFWTGFHHLPATNTVGFLSSLVFAQSNIYVWHEIIAAPTEEAKLSLLEDESWRARARESWANCWAHSQMSRPDEIVLSESETGFGPVGLTLAELIAQRGGMHPSDALADWLIDNGFRSSLFLKPWPKSRAICLGLFRDPRAIGNISDAGAHGQMLCGVGDHIDFLTSYVRDTGDLTIEEAIHNLAGKQAEFFGLADRGLIEVGKRADIVVFNLAEIERRPVERVYDVPDGEGGRTWRYSRAPAPMKLTLVNGVPTFDQGRFSGLFPGRVVSPAPLEYAAAAE